MVEQKHFHAILQSFLDEDQWLSFLSFGIELVVILYFLKTSFDIEQEEINERDRYPCKGREKQVENMEDKDLPASRKAGQALALREEGHKAQAMKTV